MTTVCLKSASKRRIGFENPHQSTKDSAWIGLSNTNFAGLPSIACLEETYRFLYMPTCNAGANDSIRFVNIIVS